MTDPRLTTQQTAREEEKRIGAIVDRKLRETFKNGMPAGLYNSYLWDGMKIVGSGGGGTSILAICRKTSAQDAVNSTPTRINYNSVTYDPLSTITTGSSWAFTAPTTGYYVFHAQLSLKVSSSDWAADRLAEFECISTFAASLLDDVKGVVVAAGASNDGRLWLRGSLGGDMAAGDDAYVRVTQNKGADMAINLASCSLIIMRA